MHITCTMSAYHMPIIWNKNESISYAYHMCISPQPPLPPLPLLPSPPPPAYTFLLLLLLLLLRLLLLPVRAGMRSHSPHADRRLLRVSPVASDCQSETCQLIGPVLTLHVSLPVLGRERPVVVLQVVLPDRALCLPTFSHLLIVNNPPPLSQKPPPPNAPKLMLF